MGIRVGERQQMGRRTGKLEALQSDFNRRTARAVVALGAFSPPGGATADACLPTQALRIASKPGVRLQEKLVQKYNSLLRMSSRLSFTFFISVAQGHA